MKVVRSFAGEKWHAAEGGKGVELRDPSTEAPLGHVSADGLDMDHLVQHARNQGGAALRELSHESRGQLLVGMSKAIHSIRDELLDLSMKSCGTTRKDSKFDIDGASGTLYHYGALGKEMGSSLVLEDGEGEQLGRSSVFWGRHTRVPRNGVAVHINAFNFPAWGFAEKAAAAILAGMPVITKPASSTCLVTERCIEAIVEADVLPDGVLSLICGSVGDLFDHLNEQDVVAFTGSADTALRIRSHSNLLAKSIPVNVEADSLNAAFLAEDVEPGSETWNLMVREVAREVTQKSGQKCTAVRRIFVPKNLRDAFVEAFVEELSNRVTGSPYDDSVNMGPLATADQLESVLQGIARLGEVADVIHGSGERCNGVGAAEGQGYFVAPTLFEAREDGGSEIVHDLEVFGPVSTLCRYDGSSATAACLNSRGAGTLVTSIYSDSDEWVHDFLRRGGSYSGRFYLGSERMAAQAPGSGLALPSSLHGGPGRAGGGEELGGLRALDLYSQRIALQGSKRTVETFVRP
ncbi:MAG: hypothetical protein CBC13_10115 [Planctomycetia bacterium TMED53]|nr:MAG: hypothetical protein CBC13_10115 [Planctomycetia bacterium TMED53]